MSVTMRLFAAIIVALASLAGVVRPVTAATLEVCPSGCSYTSIQAAIDAASDGDTISIGAGTYYEHLTLNKQVDLVGSGANQTTIDGSTTEGVIIEVTVRKAVTISGVTIRNGLARKEGGGGIQNHGTLHVKDSVLRNNDSLYGGGIHNLEYGTLEVSNSTFISNDATITGGGIQNFGVATITNSTFVENEANSGGAIHTGSDGETTITNGTISGNDADVGGGGISGDGLVTITNSIVVNNTAIDHGANCSISGDGSISGGSNIVWPTQGEQCLGSTVDPMLGPLQDNGGPTPTMAPLPGSPAIDGAANCDSIATDQRGIVRPQGEACDVGAVEITDATPPVIGAPTLTGQLGQNDWYTSDVTVAWPISELESRVTESSGCDQSTVSTDTEGITITCSATSVGGTSTKSITIKRDATAPELEMVVSPDPVSVNQTTWAMFMFDDPVSGFGMIDCPQPDTSRAGEFVHTCTAWDMAGNATIAQDSYTVTDPTPPTITHNVTGTMGDNGWFTGDVVVDWTVADPDSDVTTTGCDDTSIRQDTDGTTFVCTATSAGGSSSESVTIKRDTAGPTVSMNGNLTVPATSQSGAVVTFALPAATDAVSGVRTTTCSPASGMVFPIGETTVVCTATDQAGNQSSTSFTITVWGADEGLDILTTMVSEVDISGPAATVTSIRRTLGSMVSIARLLEASGQPRLACVQLATFELEMREQTAKRRITARDAAPIVNQSAVARAALGCK